MMHRSHCEQWCARAGLKPLQREHIGTSPPCALIFCHTEILQLSMKKGIADFSSSQQMQACTYQSAVGLICERDRARVGGHRTQV
jgi:hypothetical protein